MPRAGGNGQADGRGKKAQAGRQTSACAPAPVWRPRRGRGGGGGKARETGAGLRSPSCGAAAPYNSSRGRGSGDNSVVAAPVNEECVRLPVCSLRGTTGRASLREQSIQSSVNGRTVRLCVCVCDVVWCGVVVVCMCVSLSGHLVFVLRGFPSVVLYARTASSSSSCCCVQ